MPAQPAQSTSAMPYTHQPRRRARPRASLALVAVLAVCSCLSPGASASSPAAQALSSTPAVTGAVSLPEHALGLTAVGIEQEEEGRRLRVRQAAEEVSTTSTRQRATSSTSAAAEEDTASATAATVDPEASTVLSIGAGVGTSAVSSGDLAVASSTSGAARSATSTSSSSVSTSTAVPANYQLPEAFDSTIGTNFTSTACPSFFATFLADPTFTACAPFSLLLTTSTAFFTAERSPYGLLPYVLDASCAADTTTCASLMDRLAKQIKGSNACGPDIDKGNPLAVEALDGLLNYRMYREVGCQKSNGTEARYCFAEAAAKSEPDDLYLYYAGEGTSLPSGTTPDCGSCTEGLFSIYSRYATNSSLPISKTYSGARSAVGVACGPSIAPAVTATKQNSAPHARSAPSLSLLLSSLAPAALLFLTTAGV
ncbi:hypothetical protein JCM6882_009095 [Rhodosporidiobolus microsporus]